MNTGTELNEQSSLKEVMESDIFEELLKKKLRSVAHDRNKYMAENKIKRLKRTAFDTLHDLALWNTRGFIEQYKLMLAKQSTLSVREREYIDSVMTLTVYATVKVVKKKREAKEREAKAEAKRVLGNPIEVKPPRKPRAKRPAKNIEDSASEV